MVKGLFRFRSSRIVRESGVTMVLRALNALMMFLSTVFLARILGVEGYGIFAFVFSLALVMTMPAEAGMSLLVLRETAKGMAEKRFDRVKGVLAWSIRIVLSLSGLVMAVGLVVVGLRGLDAPIMDVFAWALPLVPIVALTTLIGGALRGYHHVVAGQVSDMLIRPGFFVVALLPFFLFPRLTLEPAAAMGVFLAASFSALTVGFWLLWANFPAEVKNTAEITTERYWLKSSVLFGLMTGMGVLINQASTILLGIFDDAESVAIYRVAFQISMLGTFGLNAINQVVAPRFARLHAEGKRQEMQDLVTRSAKVAFIFSIIVTCGFVFFGKEAINVLFGKEFSSAFYPLLILLFGQVVNAMSGPVGFLLNMTGNEREAATGMLFAVVVALVLGLVLVVSMGATGAALATATSMVIWNMYLWCRARKILDVNSMAFEFQMCKK